MDTGPNDDVELCPLATFYELVHGHPSTIGNENCAWEIGVSITGISGMDISPSSPGGVCVGGSQVSKTFEGIPNLKTLKYSPLKLFLKIIVFGAYRSFTTCCQLKLPWWLRW